jgi:hypothetical protein
MNSYDSENKRMVAFLSRRQQEQEQHRESSNIKGNPQNAVIALHLFRMLGRAGGVFARDTKVNSIRKCLIVNFREMKQTYRLYTQHPVFSIFFTAISQVPHPFFWQGNSKPTLIS